MHEGRTVVLLVALLMSCAQDLSPPAGAPSRGSAPPTLSLPSVMPQGLPPENVPPASPRPPRPSEIPPPISGGTLLVTHGGSIAVAADPDRDRLFIVDLSKWELRKEIALDDGDEPGRIAEDQAGRLHVVLRGAGALLTVEPAGWTISARRATCPAPRGVAHDPAGDQVHVACGGGELVSLPAAGGTALRRLSLDPDLRDVIVQNGRLFVSRFRQAELLEIGKDGQVLWRGAPKPVDVLDSSPSQPDVAWRTVPLATGGIVMLHQRALTQHFLGIDAGGFAGWEISGCGFVGIVQGAVTYFAPPMDVPVSPVLPAAVVPVDLAISPDGSRIALVAAAAGDSGQVLTLPTDEVTASSTCAGDLLQAAAGSPQAGAVAVAYTGDGRLLVQTREPAALLLLPGPKALSLSGTSRADPGHTLFHSATENLVACASCHPEAGDDGQVWTFTMLGKRRTQHLRGGLLATAPFHWDGLEKDILQLMMEVFTGRMGGPAVAPAQATAVGQWLDAQPALPVALGAADAGDHGEQLFHDANVGCSSCHSGPHFTNNLTLDVGTGGAFQVPSLIGVALRAPYLHAGQAATLRERFGPQGGGDQHGYTSGLSPGDLDDLIAYLKGL